MINFTIKSIIILLLTTQLTSSDESIPIKQIVMFLPQIQTYSVTSSITNKSPSYQLKFIPAVDRQFYVRHWQQNLHDEVLQRVQQKSKVLNGFKGLNAQEELEEQKSFKNKFIDKYVVEANKDKRTIFLYCILVVFVIFVSIKKGKKTTEFRQRIQMEQEQLEIDTLN